MKKLLAMSLALVGTLALAGIASAATPADTLQPATTITYNEELIVNNTIRVNSAYIGSTEAGVGGVTFFNGTMINNSVDEDGNSTIPLTIGDDLRVDGEIYRTERGGADSPLKVSDTIIPTMDNTNDFGSSSNQWKDGYFAGALAVGSLSGTGIVSSANLADSAVTGAKIASGAVGPSDLANDAVTGAKIASGAVESSDLADDAVTGEKIADGTVGGSDLDGDSVSESKIADGSVTPDKISGEGGANLPIAYGAIDFNGGVYGATSNVTASQIGTGKYEIVIDGRSFSSWGDFAISVTNNTTGTYSVYTYNGSNNIEVWTYNSSDALANASFSFVVYGL